jgi:flagellin-specific chaperone FliS
MKLTEPVVAEHYTRVQILTASRQKQIAMMHEKCVVDIARAMDESGPQRKKLLDNAQNILAQFQSALRIEDNVSEGLFYIYDYAYMLLERGEDSDCVKAVEVLSVIRDTFKALLLPS